MNIDYSNKFFLFIRAIIIFLGLKKIFHKIINVSSGKNYEIKFSRIMLSKVKPNDIVWDIGANVGFYTKKFHKLIKINPRDKHLKKNGWKWGLIQWGLNISVNFFLICTKNKAFLQ